MMRWLALPFALLSVSAWAQQPPAIQASPYAPITLDEKAYKEITAYLMDQPAKFSIPMLNWLEMQARTAAMMANRAKEAPKADLPKPEPPK